MEIQEHSFSPLRGAVTRRIDQVYRLMARRLQCHRTVINTQSDHDEQMRARAWAGGAAGHEPGCQYGQINLAPVRDLCTSPDEGKVRIINTISMFNTSVGATACRLYISSDVLDVPFHTAPAIGVDDVEYWNHPIVLPYGFKITGSAGAGQSLDVTTHYADEPIGLRAGEFQYASEIQEVVGTDWVTVCPEPDPGTSHIMRTLTLANNTVPPNPVADTVIALVDTGTDTRYPISPHHVGSISTDVFSEVICLEEGWELQAQHDVDPVAFYTIANYGIVTL